MLSFLIRLINVLLNHLQMLLDGTTSNILLNRQHILMFATTLTIPGEQKVSMNKRNPLASQLLLLPAYILE